MRTSTLRKTGLAAAAASALIAVGVPFALAAPTAAPPSDSAGYLDSTARCTKPDIAVLFGATQSSRIAVCKTAAEAFEYRGVRMSDGATLIATATQTSGNTFTVKNDGVQYTITPTALSVTANGDTFRTETWTDFHSTLPMPASGTSSTPGTSAAPSKSTTAPSAGSTPASTTAAATPGLTTSSAPKPTSTVPLPPPMAAEVGGSSSSSE